MMLGSRVEGNPKFSRFQRYTKQLQINDFFRNDHSNVLKICQLEMLFENKLLMLKLKLIKLICLPHRLLEIIKVLFKIIFNNFLQ